MTEAEKQAHAMAVSVIQDLAHALQDEHRAVSRELCRIVIREAKRGLLQLDLDRQLGDHWGES